MNKNTNTMPLRERKKDLFFIIIFGLFAFTSFSGDALHALGLMEDDGVFAEGNRRYMEAAQDHFLAAGHDFSRFNTSISAFVYGPFYLLLVHAFVRGSNFIRPLALLYVGAIVMSTSQFIWWEYAIGPAPGVDSIFWAFNGPYILVPILLAARVWKEQPFSR
jgi:hypothetical protein